MLGYQHSGFSVDAGMCIEAHDRAALPPTPEPAASPKRSQAHYLWAVLIARIYEVFPLLCPLQCIEAYMIFSSVASKPLNSSTMRPCRETRMRSDNSMISGR
jgi:hypothetical protein